MSASIPSVFLDLDGTLIDSQPGILASCRVALRTLGHEPQSSLDISSLVGPPVEEVMRVLLKPYGDDRVTEAGAAYRAACAVHPPFASVPPPRLAHALSAIAEAGAARSPPPHTTTASS